MTAPQLLEAPQQVFRDTSDLMMIEDLAASEAALLERVADLETDVANLEVERRWYREISIAAIHALRDLTQKLDRARWTAAVRAEHNRQVRAKAAV